MTTKLLKGALARFAVMAIAAVFFTPLATAAVASGEIENPVTGETETYVNTFTGGTDGTATEWNSAGNWDTGNTPFISGNYDPALVNGKTASTSTAIDGWTLRVGAYNNASVTWSGGITKIQAGTVGCWLTAADTSKITIASFAGNQLEGSDSAPFKLTSENAGGITWSSGLTSASNTSLPFWYYLKGAGTVVYGGDITVANAQVIKQADVTLTGTSQVSSKTLVSFASTTKTFTADAEIKVYGTDGTTLKKIVAVGSVRAAGTAMESASSILTTASPVGSCEIVQCTDGIVLYYVDGDYSSSAGYKPSISVNFCHGNAPLITSADVGYGDYAVPGMFWNNMVSAGGSDGTFTTPLSTIRGIKSTGEPTLISGASVAVSGTRGSWSCGSVAAAKDLRQGYVDDAAGANASPQVAISGIPYYSYYAVVYFSNNDPNVKFGYVTINGTNYKWDDTTSALVECEGASTDSWGASSPTAWTEGGNYIVTPTFVNSDGSFTIVSHRLTSGGVTARSGIAAIQIVEVPKVAEEGELVINVSGDTTYTVSENATYTTVYVTGAGTLAFSGEGTITTTTLNVGPGATVPMGSSITPTTVTGSGTALYDGVKPTTGLGWTDSANWTGTVWVKNITTSNDARKDWDPALYGNAESTLRFTDVNLYFPNNTTTAFSGTVELDAGGLNICDGYGGSIATFARLSGSGTLSTSGGSSNGNGLTINDASAFTGTITLTKFKVVIGTATGTSASGVLQIDSGAAATVASGKTWTAPGGFVVNGTLNADGTLASSHASQAVSGSGTVVFTGKLPSPTGDTWWKNSAWDGTVQVKNAAFTGVSGVTTYLEVNKYGNDGSVLELNNCSGWLPVGNTSGDNVCAVPLKVTGTLNINDGYSGRQFTINKLLGDGAIYTDSNGATVTIQVLNADGFTGKVQLNSKRVVFGATIPGTFTSGQIYVGSDFTFTVPNENAAWYGTGGILLDGELKANALSNFGGGTTITTTDNGVLTLLTASQIDDQSTSYARITGTGTLRYADGGGNNWRTLSQTDFPTGMICENNIAAGLILKTAGGNHTIGSLAGSGQMRSDWGGSGNTGDRDLRILQAKDTIYSGVFSSSNDRVRDVYVAPGTSTAGTLTLSGTQTASNGLTVESGAAVNLTGTWVGATTVAGTFGGTGTLTGNLTFNAGSTFKAFASDENGLSVSDSITCPASGTVTVDVSALGASAAKVVLLTAANESDIDLSKFALADGPDPKCRLAKEGATLVVKRIKKKVLVIVK